MKIKEQFLGAIAFAGDMTMGQPPEHSPTTACLAARIATLDNQPADVIARASQLAMIRWGGCSANAVGFAELFGDDVIGRRELLAGRNPFVARPSLNAANAHNLPATLPEKIAASSDASFYGKLMPLLYSHCEVIAEIAARAHFSPELISTIDDLFEYRDGSGMPLGKTGDQYDRCVQYVWLASDIELYARFHGAAKAAEMIQARAGSVYDAALAKLAIINIEPWLQEIHAAPLLSQAYLVCDLSSEQPELDLESAIYLLSDFADLKRPHYAGMSRNASQISQTISKRLNASNVDAQMASHATLLHALGYVSVTNAAFGRNTRHDHESLRLVPYWTERILSRAPDLHDACKIAAMAFERLDGSGWHKGLTRSNLPLSARIAQVAIAAAEASLDDDSLVSERLLKEAAAGRLDAMCVDACLSLPLVVPPSSVSSVSSVSDSNDVALFTTREREVLTHLIRGISNKEIAQVLGISPKTVGTHLENCYRKLAVRTRAAAAIKALKLGLLVDFGGGRG